MHYDANISVTYFINCSGNIIIEGKHYDIHSGDIVFMSSNEMHCCNIDDNTYHERVSVCINKSILDNFQIECNELIDFFICKEKGIGNIITSDNVKKFNMDELILNILALSKNNSNSNKILCICKITELLYQLKKASSHTPSVVSGYADNSPIISQALKYIDLHFTEKIDCTKVANALYISKFHLEHIFKNCIGISLWEYVTIKRLMLVNELIQKNHSIEQASSSAGFNNYSNFYRLYKKHFNTTPLQYKKLISR